MATFYKCTVLLVCILLVGCDPTATTELPSERPKGTISGYVIDGVIANATVTIFGFGDGTKGARLGGGVTNNEGAYSIEIQTHSQPILIEISGGSYIEQASGTSVTLEDGQVLRTVTFYNSGTNKNVMVTTLTHIISGLAEYKALSGTHVEQAINEASNVINSFFNLNATETQPIDITSVTNTASSLSNEALYGFYLAGISNWTYWVSNQNRITPHTTYTSIALAQIIYNDIQADGLLDGFGYNADRSELIPLAVGIQPLNTDTYRIMFSLHMLAAATIATNNTNLKPADLLPVANNIAEKTSDLIGNANSVEINEQSPELTLESHVQNVYSGVFDFQINIGGLLGANLIRVILIDDNSGESVNLGELENPKIPLIIVDTTDYADGPKVIRVEAIDALGNEANLEFPVRFDNTEPVINTSGRHSVARFSSGDGNYTEDSLQDINNLAPLYLETNKIDLNGVLISRDQLDNNAIPYFALSVSDILNPGITTDPQYFQVFIQYQRDGEIIYPWHEIPASDEEYLIPLVSELLSPQWHQTSASAQHQILVQAFDAAGNPSIITGFSFFADFYVPVISLDPTLDITDIDDARFVETPFVERSDLNNIEFSSNRYTLTNTVGNSYYISLADDSAHTVDQQADQLVREHLVNKTTTSEWQVGLMTISDTANCPEFVGWTPVSSIMNWTTTGGWREETVPAPVVVEQATDSDELPATEGPTEWIDTPDFAPTNEEPTPVPHSSTVINQNTDSVLTVRYDYVLVGEQTQLLPQTAFVVDWVLNDPTQNPRVKVCPGNQRNFQQRSITVFESVPGYPKTTQSTISLPNTPTFSTTQFQVVDNNTSLPIEPVNGWYRIPAGDNSISITKSVVTPTLVEHNDDVSDIENHTSYTPNWNDQSITWSVNRNISITAIHDAGEANISVMPTRTNNVGAGTVDYQIAR